MVPDWLARVTAARHAPAVGCALLAAAAAGQAIAQAVAHAQQDHPAAVPGAVPAVEYAMPLVAFALLATLPAALLPPARGGARDRGGQRGVAGLVRHRHRGRDRRRS